MSLIIDIPFVLPECAKVLYDALGCALLEDGMPEEGKAYSLLGSTLEIVVEANCRSVS